MHLEPNENIYYFPFFTLLLTHSSSAVHSVPCQKHDCILCVTKARDRKHPWGSGSTDSLRLSPQAHSYFCYMNPQLFILKKGSGRWLCLHPCTSVPQHCLWCVKHEEGQQGTSPFAQERNACHNSTLGLGGDKTAGEEKRTWRTGSQVTCNQWIVVTADLCLRCIHFLLSLWKFCTNNLGNLSICLKSTCDKGRRQKGKSVTISWS